MYQLCHRYAWHSNPSILEVIEKTPKAQLNLRWEDRGASHYIENLAWNIKVDLQPGSKGFSLRLR